MNPPPVTSYVLYDCNADGIVDASDVATLSSIMGGAPLPPGIPLARLTMGNVVSGTDIVTATRIANQSLQPFIIPWIQAAPTTLLVSPPGVLRLNNGFDAYIRTEVDCVVVLHLANAASVVTSIQLRALDGTVVDARTNFWTTPGLGVGGDRSINSVFVQFHLAQGWWVIHFDTVLGATLTGFDYAVLTSPNQVVGPVVLDMVPREARSFVLPRGSTTFDVSATQPGQSFQFAVAPLAQGITQCDVGRFGDPAGPAWALMPQTNVPEFDLSQVRPEYTQHTRALGFCGTLPTEPIDNDPPASGDLIPLGWIVPAEICPSGDTRNFQSLDPSFGVAILTEYWPATDQDFPAVQAITPVLEKVVPAWRAFSGFEDETYNFFLYHGGTSQTLAFLNLGDLWRPTARIFVNLDLLETYDVSQWPDLLGPMPIWSSYLHRWFQSQQAVIGPLPADFATALTYTLANAMGYKPYYLSELRLGEVAAVVPWLSYFTGLGATEAARLEAVETFLQNLFGGLVPVDLDDAAIVAAVQALLNDIRVVAAVAEQFVAVLGMYSFTEVLPDTLDPVILKNFLVGAIPPKYNNIMIATSQTQVDLMDSQILHGSTSVFQSPLCDLVTNEDLASLPGHTSLTNYIAREFAPLRLLLAWQYDDAPTAYLAMLGQRFASALTHRALRSLGESSPAIEQNQIVRAWRVTRHRLLRASYLLPPEETAKILAWPDPISAAAIQALPATYDLALGQTSIALLTADGVAVAGSLLPLQYTVPVGANSVTITLDVEAIFVARRMT